MNTITLTQEELDVLIVSLQEKTRMMFKTGEAIPYDEVIHEVSTTIVFDCLKVLAAMQDIAYKEKYDETYTNRRLKHSSRRMGQRR